MTAALLRPRDLEHALALVAGGARPLAGATDVWPSVTGADLPGPMVDLTALPDLSGITATQGGGLRIGACTTWGQVARAPLPPALHALQQAARLVGGQQIQTAATLGGNLCTASPAADGVPPLLACDAAVELAGPRGPRALALADFLTGPRRTALAPDEVLVAVHLPAAGLAGASRFAKLGARAHLVISIVMVAVRLTLHDGRIAAAAIAVGACAPTARRLPAVEAALAGVPLAEAASRIGDGMVAEALAPIDDIRASAPYRRSSAAELIR
ncbi:MAG TPA: FAD binding domain-containing protein, partial [Paracoccaceae bacterium]|nr:FAD binding domain-containing protein [Paracoccaceae bacterium]